MNFLKNNLFRFSKRFILLFSMSILIPFSVRASESISDIKSGSNLILSATGLNEVQATMNAPTWLILPFLLLITMIATGPLFYERFWHNNYRWISLFLSGFVIFYYVFILHNLQSPVHSITDYVQFISLLTGLFVVSSGIMIDVDKKSTPLANISMLFIGAIVSNIIGTTGASMLLIRPYIRLNRGRIKAYHIVFFIFIISNIGGSLTPIGDPPLFLGFLKGVPFFWTITHNFFPWFTAIILLLSIFYFFDKRNKTNAGPEFTSAISNKISLKGRRSFLWLSIIVLSVFIDPNVFSWVPALAYHGQKISFIRELIILGVAVVSHFAANKEALKSNDFTFEPIKEVAFLFIGIFGTMIPALELVGVFASGPGGERLITHNTLFWTTGALSSFLDNAPTYLNFLAAGMSSSGADINVVSHVNNFARGFYPDSILNLTAISVSAVFFGANTYIGNGPNFMVKSIAEQSGIRMPSFFGYMIRYSIPILLPILFIVWVLYFGIHPT
jgi:Na+/H+ antiporter NhaD/arsenite permease-like protein